MSDARPLPEREVPVLPVLAVCVVLLTVAAIVFTGRHAAAPAHPVATVSSSRRGDEPTPVRDTDHYVPGSPPAVAERFLRAWMRGRYDEARDLAYGPMRARAETELAEVGAFNAAQMEEFRRTRVYTAATNYDLDHVTMHDAPADADGNARKIVEGQAHAYAVFPGTHADSRRGQTFTLELVDGAWRVVERTWETFDRARPAVTNDPLAGDGGPGHEP